MNIGNNVEQRLEAIEIQEVENTQEKQKSSNYVKNQTLNLIKNVLSKEIEANNWETQQSVDALLRLFNFVLEKYLVIDEEITINEKIITRYSLNKEWEKKLKNILVFLKMKNLLDDELSKKYNFSALNKKIKYHEIGIETQDFYSQEELESLLLNKNVKKIPELIQQINHDIEWCKKQVIYKQKIDCIIQEFNIKNFTNQAWDLTGKINWDNKENSIYPIYNNILTQATKHVNNIYEAIEFSNYQENPEYINKIQKEKNDSDEDNNTKSHQELPSEIKKPFYKDLKYLFAAVWLTVGASTLVLNQNEQSNVIKDQQSQNILSEAQRVELFRWQLKVMIQNKIDELIEQGVNIYIAKNIIWKEIIEMYGALIERNKGQIIDTKRNFKSNTYINHDTMQVFIKNNLFDTEMYEYTFYYPVDKSPFTQEEQTLRAKDILQKKLSSIVNKHQSVKSLMDELTSEFKFIIEESTYISYANYKTTINYDYIDHNNTDIEVIFHNNVDGTSITISFNLDNLNNLNNH